MSENFVERQIILGAGASCNENKDSFPVGSELKEIIIRVKATVESILNNKSGSDRESYNAFIHKLEEFIKNFRLSNLPSIDAFIARCNDRDLMEDKSKNGFSYSLCDISSDSVGCSLIAAIIWQYQNRKKQIEWYGELIPLFFPAIEINDNQESILKNFEEHLRKVKVITFNYDISLECFLYDFLVKSYFKQFANHDKKKQELFALICSRIEHVYGFLCKKDDLFNQVQEVQNLSQEDFAPRDDLDKKLSNIIDDNEVVEKAFDIWLKNDTSIKIIGRGGNHVKAVDCEYLYILGFGFDQMNLDNIGLNHTRASSVWRNKCFITNYSKSSIINRLAKDHFLGKDKSSDPDFGIYDRNINDCLSRDNGSFSLTEVSHDVIRDWDQLLYGS